VKSEVENLAEGRSLPTPHCALGVSKFDVGAVGWYAKGGLDFGAEVLAHGLGAIAAHGPYTLDLYVAGGVCCPAKGHCGAGLKGSHHIGFGFT